ncbi:ATP-dependent RecD-like DNA helicase [Clostridium sp. D2Q-11]|uniref:ATP-dependent RecD2 DNA helicase n=1 Tax=Anaeromonas frigoriresistens TaxID=2683708 RepID=A0A942UXH6_9FIRM|nr:ATP-dependent RecD-like DNA helicase [Anaeromonas frigoriresistens]
MISIQGTVEEIIFRNESNGYVVAILETEDDIVTIVGYIPIINIGETIQVEGTWEKHKNYGQQLKVENYTPVVPATMNGIINYLSSGLITGIGPKTAEKIVDKFGEDSIDILQYNPERLKEIDGIGKKKIKKIVESFEEQRDLKDVMMFLQQYNISSKFGIKIYKKYGKETIAKVKENPYRLSEEVFGIGFKMADKMAISMGIDFNSKYRIMAGIKYALMQYSTEGHTYIMKNMLINKSKEILQIPEEEIDNGITSMALENNIKLENFDGELCVYSLPFYVAETNVSKKLVEISKVDLPPLKIDVDKEIHTIENTEGITLANRQKEAIKEAVSNGVLVVTGGPGTGKTTTINSIIQLFEKQGLDITLAAPTGRAAKRMSETTGKEAKTIHRLLEYNFIDEEIGMDFGRDDGTPMESDVVIIDEVSMVDILLMNNLLKAIMPGTRLILVGDVDQLPSVGAGNVLRDIIDSKLIKVVQLDEIFRQAKESMIVVNAHRINSGEYPHLNKKGKDFFFMTRGNGNDISNTILELVKERLPKFNGYDPIADIQILTPMKKGDVGVNALNEKIQNILNPKHKLKNERKQGDTLFRVGDKIMQIKNNYRTEWKIYDGSKVTEEGEGVFNGDLGIITGIDNEESELTVLFDDKREVTYPFAQLDELRLSYATTIHKSQGSEFPVVIIPVFWGPPMLLTRNLLYTGITRAKELVVLVGMERYLNTMISNNRITKRYSGLSRRLKDVFEFYMRS